MKELIPLGVLVIFIGIIMVSIGALSQASKPESQSKVAIGGFIGFIPFGFANDKRMLYISMGLTAAFMLFWIWFISHR